MLDYFLNNRSSIVPQSGSPAEINSGTDAYWDLLNFPNFTEKVYNTNTLKVGGGGLAIYFINMKFDLSAIPAGATVTNATLTLTPITAPITIGQASLGANNTDFTVTDAGRCVDYTYFEEGLTGTFTTVTQIIPNSVVQGWLDVNNYGFHMDANDATPLEFHSFEASTSTNCPKLTVEYTI
jgi:hypothetical protein